jgi:RHH-type proline utilization regulon transcriptional repressor/proline dehydrogenase/delta 1-pyrroline-5-carboxylate dehydrogenase
MSEELDRNALREAYRMDEDACSAARISQAGSASEAHETSAKLAARLIADARQRKASGIDAFLQQFGLDTEEGIALMCLAEALLRVPDAETADLLIKDKLGEIDWSDHLGDSSSTFVNAATFSLMLTGEVLDPPEQHQRGMGATLKRTMNRLGEPVIRNATLQAMKILGGQFVFGRTIDEALERAAPERKEGLTHSFDMLGEAAMTYDDAAKYAHSYRAALERLAQDVANSDPQDRVARAPGISVKLSALHPKYDELHGEQTIADLLPVLRDMMIIARDADIHFTIDAEEAERLELSLDIIEALVADHSLFARADGTLWQGFGLALQAYQKRAVPLCEWVGELARKHGRRLFVRLVKGAYWDSEIKLSQVGGYADYPVFTRKIATDVSYLACAARLFEYADVIRPAFATHNAYTIAAIKTMAKGFWSKSLGGFGPPFEFQRLHGMGEEVYAALSSLEGKNRTPVRIYAPVGGHKELLAYLVRRLLENGANTSFVNRMADSEVALDDLTANPVEQLRELRPLRNPAIPLPKDIFGDRVNSAGIDLSDRKARAKLQRLLGEIDDHEWEAWPDLGSDKAGRPVIIKAPYNAKERVGKAAYSSQIVLDFAAKAATRAQPEWEAIGADQRALLLEETANLFEKHSAEFFSLCQREAGKTLPDAILELREAVDFLRYYAAEARRLFDTKTLLPGPTGEENTLRLHARGVFATISPWNFPLAIFVGPAAAALAAGNCVLAKPAEQTPLIAALAIQLFHEAGIPREVIQLVPGDGTVGAALTSHPLVSGVAFTGSTDTARAINRSLAEREGPIAPLIAETGGLNAMIVDSSALPEQVVRDVIASAFQSAGQRCSALRVLYLQSDIAQDMLDMIAGGFAALNIGDPRDLACDVGPVIDSAAKQSLDDHIAAMRTAGHKIAQLDLPRGAPHGSFVAPTIIKIDSIADLDQEPFGPILHVATFKAGEIDKVVNDINERGYGLTLGLHSRIAATRELVEAKARVGNFYVNRNQIGAVVESQPFGGEGLSGTGPKAGGPHYVARFATERVTCVDTTAAGGNASLLAGDSSAPLGD